MVVPKQDFLQEDQKRLEELIELGECPTTDQPRDIKVRHPEFAKYGAEQFRNKLNYLRNKMKGLAKSKGEFFSNSSLSLLLYVYLQNTLH